MPIITQATINGGNLLLTSYACPNSTVELLDTAVGSYVANTSGFVEGPAYLATVTAGISDNNASTGGYDRIINGRNQGTDTINKFSFSILVQQAL